MELFEQPTRKGKRDKSLRFSSSSYMSDLGSNKKQVVFKVASNIKNKSSRSVDDTLNYISRDGDKFKEEEFLGVEDEMGNVHDKDSLKEIKSAWKDEFSNEKERARTMTHFVLSVDEELTKNNYKDFESSIRDFCSERLGDEGYRYVFTIHNDTDKPHAHIVINNNNLDTGKKFRMDNQWLYETRVMAKEHLEKNGFSYAATLKSDRDVLKARDLADKEQFRKVNNWFEAQIKNNAVTPKQLEDLLEKQQMLKLADQHFSNNSHDQDAAMEFRRRLNDARNAMTDTEKYRNKTQALYAVGEVLRQANVTKQLIEQARSNEERKIAHQAKKMDYQINRAAGDLVKAEKHLASMPTKQRPKEYDELISAIEKQKEYFVKHHDIDFNAVKDRLEKPRNPHHVDLEKLAKKSIRSVERGNATEKTVYRFFDELEKIKAKAERGNNALLKAHVNETIATAMKAYKKAGIDIVTSRDHWSRQNVVKKELSSLRVDMTIASKDGSLSTREVVEKFQRRIDKLSTSYSSSALSKKDQIQMKKSIDARQNQIDFTNATPRAEVNNLIKSIERQLIKAEKSPSVEKVRPYIVKRVSLTSPAPKVPLRDNEQSAIKLRLTDKEINPVRFHAVGHRVVEAQHQIKQLALSSEDHKQVNSRIAQLEKQLNEAGINMDSLRTRREIHERLQKVINQPKQVIMTARNQDMKPSIDRLLSSYHESKSTLEDIKNDKLLSEYQKKGLIKEFKDNQSQALGELDNRRNAFWTNLKLAKELVKRAQEIRTMSPKDMSNMDRVAFKRELANIGEQFSKLSSELKRDMAVVSKPEQRRDIEKQIVTMIKTIGKAHSRGFER